MTNSAHLEDRASEPSIRDNWPRGFFGWLSYVFDHRLRGFRRPVDWHSLWAWEQTNHGEPVFANGGVLILLGFEVDVFRLIASGLCDAEVAATLRLAERKVRKLRHEIAYRLGVSSPAELAAVVEQHQHLR